MRAAVAFGTCNSRYAPAAPSATTAKPSATSTRAGASAEALWTRPFKDEKSGESRRCSQCHSEDLRRPGKHATTGKVIEPLAPSANPKRLTDPEHIEKWFLRNCKWTMGRECTPQEKGDFLVMIKGK
jgi:hypothetical protein